MYTLRNDEEYDTVLRWCTGAVVAGEARMRARSHPIGLGWRHRGEPVSPSDTNSHPWAELGYPRVSSGDTKTNV